MEETLTFHPYKPLPPPPTMLTVGEDSHTISKSKPKIKIVHIFAPEVIKTDAANFRELVQRLTGQPLRRAAGKKKKKKVAERCKSSEVGLGLGLGFEPESYQAPMHGGGNEVRIGGESDYFLEGLGDVDSFFEGLGNCSLLPCSSSTRVEVGGEDEHAC